MTKNNIKKLFWKYNQSDEYIDRLYKNQLNREVILHDNPNLHISENELFEYMLDTNYYYIGSDTGLMVHKKIKCNHMKKRGEKEFIVTVANGSTTNGGYKTVTPCTIAGVKVCYTVANAMASTYLPYLFNQTPADGKLEVHHMDGDRLHNELSNLLLVPQKGGYHRKLDQLSGGFVYCKSDGSTGRWIKPNDIYQFLFDTGMTIEELLDGICSDNLLQGAMRTYTIKGYTIMLGHRETSSLTERLGISFGNLTQADKKTLDDIQNLISFTSSIDIGLDENVNTVFIQ